MHVGILNTPRFRNTRNQQQIACFSARQSPNIKTVSTSSGTMSRAAYLQSAYNANRFQRTITVRQQNTCDNDPANCGTFPYPNQQIPTTVNQFGVFSGGKRKMIGNFK